MTKFLNTRILLSGATILAAAVVIVGATLAFFSDVETSEANAFTAGDVQIAISDLQHAYTGGGIAEDVPTFDPDGFSFNLTDIKPLDSGSVSYVLSNQANDAQVCAMVEEDGNTENARNSSELEAGDETGGNPGEGNGELQDFMSFAFGGDSGLLSEIAGEWFNVGTVDTDATGNFAIGYCFGEYDGTNCVANDPGDVNLAQTDGMTADISFYAVQTRNNETFNCASLNDGGVGGDFEVADSYSSDFEDSPYILGDINGQDGWSMTGPYDVEVDDSDSTTGFGGQSLRISNAVTSGSFGDWAFAPSLSSAAGETSENHYEAEFDIASVIPGSVQTDLQVSVAPTDSAGSRMSYLRFEDEADGIHVFFNDATNAGPLGSSTTFNESDIAILDRTVPHTVKFVMDFIAGDGNDVVKIYIDNVLVHTGTSWEDYYRYDPEQTGNGNLVPEVNTLIFQARGNGSSDNIVANDGNGYLFDNLSLSSGSI